MFWTKFYLLQGSLSILGTKFFKLHKCNAIKKPQNGTNITYK